MSTDEPSNVHISLNLFGRTYEHDLYGAAAQALFLGLVVLIVALLALLFGLVGYSIHRCVSG